MQDPVLFNEIITNNGKKIGHATLHKAKALNALNIDMIRALTPQLKAWQADPEVVCIMLDGEGDKAFCAGGDVVAMHNAMQQDPGSMPESLFAFFKEEYELDYLIHSFGKPVIAWGNGIVMGGGLGLMCGASHRIVTETSRIAMPEITIGLYPDVGGSWFLNQMPSGCGLFLGLTGASINASDALYVKLADHFIAHEMKTTFIESLQGISWGANDSLNRQKLSDSCHSFHKQCKTLIPSGNVKKHQKLISQVTSDNNVQTVVDNILAAPSVDDKWLSRAQSGLKSGSPITMHLVQQQLVRAESLSLAECFQMELIVSCRCGEYGEFQEGVRALLIDKDNNPKWKFAAASEVPQEVVEWFFTSPWEAQNNPLNHLGE